MKKINLAILLIAILCLAIPPVLAETWDVESGTYSNGVHQWNQASSEIDNGTIQINETSGQWYILYTSVPQGNFTASLDVYAKDFFGFDMELRSGLPFAGSTNGLNFELSDKNGGSFLLSRMTDFGWTWNPVMNGAQNNVWYNMTMIVQSSPTVPFNVTAIVYDANGVILGAYSATDMNSPTFTQLQYVGFGCAENGGNYTVTNVNIASLDAQASTPSPTPTDNPTQTPTNTPSPSPSIPEIPSLMILLLLLIPVSLAIVLLEKRRNPKFLSTP